MIGLSWPCIGHHVQVTCTRARSPHAAALSADATGPMAAALGTGARPGPAACPRTVAALDDNGRDVGEQIGMGRNEKEVAACGRSFAMQGGGGVSRSER